ncbi:MAG: Ig-like domain-containing protein [Muribaculaceae bacterium]|nr:Ig-like domain-containing protein [Muribaculaceae bacterium]
MKKLLLTLWIASMAFSGFSFERILYSENYETSTDVSDTGWSTPNGTLSLYSSDTGKCINLYQGGGSGSRSFSVTWGENCYKDKDGNSLLDDGVYYMSFDFCYTAFSNNKYDGCLDVFTNHAQKENNQAYRMPWRSDGKGGVWENFIFDMSQDNENKSPNKFFVNAATQKTENEDNTVSYSIPAENPFTLTKDNWYSVTLAVNTNSRTVEYTVQNLEKGKEADNISGTRLVPEVNPDGSEISMYAQGLYVLAARAATNLRIDNIKIYCESDDVVANPPSITLSSIGKDSKGVIDLKFRSYNITFLESETLHVTGTDGSTKDIKYSECNGSYIYETSTSGTLTVWTSIGNTKSEEVYEEIDCTPIILPEATVSITSISEGYGKTYSFSASNANVLLKPEISFSYVFTGKSGKKSEGTGDKVTVTEEGTLAVTTLAAGYQSTTTQVENNGFFALKKKWDFARMTDDEITNAGFPEYTKLNSNASSGFDQWTGRKRLYYKNSGSTVYPFGFVSSSSSNVLYHSTIGSDTNVAGKELFPGITVYAGHNVRYMKHIGMVNDETVGGNDKNIDVLYLDENDIVVINKISGYGNDSNHPECATDEEYYAQLSGVDTFYKASEGTLNSETGKYTVSCPVYRIDTAATSVTVYSEVDLNADYTYTLLYVNEDDDKTIKEAEGKGKFGSAITLTEEETADFEFEGVKYVVSGNDAEGKTVTLEGTTVTIKCYATAEYTINYVDGEEIIKTVTKSGKVGSTIEFTKEDTAEFQKDGITYIYDGFEPENPTIGADGKTVVTLKFHKKSEVNYTVKFVDQDGNEIKESATRIGDAGNAVTISDDDKEDIVVDGVTYVYTSDNTKDLTYAYDGSTEVIITYNKVVDYTIKFVDESGTEIKAAEKGSGAIGSEITLPEEYLQDIKIGGKRYIYVGNNLESNKTITADGTTVTITYRLPKIGEVYTIVNQEVFAKDESLEESTEYTWGEDIKGLITDSGLALTNSNSKDNNYENLDFITFENAVGSETSELNISYAVNHGADKGQDPTYYTINYFNAAGDFVFGIQEGSGNGYSFMANIITANKEGEPTTTTLPAAHIGKNSKTTPVNLTVRHSGDQAIIDIDGDLYSAYTSSEGIKEIKLSVSGEQDFNRFMSIEKYVVKTTEIQPVDYANYTLDYVCDGKSIKSETHVGVVGSAITLNDLQIANFFNEDKTAKYIYVSNDVDGKKVAAGGSTVVTINYRKAATWNYTVTNNVNSNVEEGSVLEGESAAIPYSKYIIAQDGTVWTKDATNKEYNFPVKPDTDDYVTEMVYKEYAKDGIYFIEAEDIKDVSIEKNGQIATRGSNDKGAYSSEAVEVCTVKPGTYKVEIAVAGNSGATLSVFAGSEEPIVSASTNGNWTQVTSEEVTLVSETVVTFKGGASQKVLDYILITGKVTEVTDIELNESVLELTIGNEKQLNASITPDITDVTIEWKSSKPNVATVENGKVTAVGVGKTTITATCGKATASCEVKVFAQQGDVTWNGSIDVTDATDITNYVVGKKTADEGWDAAEWDEFYKKAADVNNDNNITFADASATISIVLDQKKDASTQNRISAYHDDSMDALVIGRVSASSKGSVIPVTLDNTEAYVALQADIFLPEGMNVDVKEGSRIADSHTMLTKKHADNHIRVVIFNLGNNAFADNDAPILEIVTDSYVSASDIAISTIIASDTDANGYVLASRAADTNGVAAIGLDPEAPVKVFDVNGIYVSDTMEGLQQGTYIVRQGEVAKTVRVR